MTGDRLLVFCPALCVSGLTRVNGNAPHGTGRVRGFDGDSAASRSRIRGNEIKDSELRSGTLAVLALIPVVRGTFPQGVCETIGLGLSRFSETG